MLSLVARSVRPSVFSRSISVGANIPAVENLKKVRSGEISATSVDELFSNKKVVVFGVPGAFTPTCTMNHLPGYVSNADSIKAKGVDDVVCVAVNDPFVMKAWGESANAADKVTFLCDGNGDLTRALELSLDASAHGLGVRCKRFSAVVDNGKVVSLNLEDPPTGLTNSAAEKVLESL